MFLHNIRLLTILNTLCYSFVALQKNIINLKLLKMNLFMFLVVIAVFGALIWVFDLQSIVNMWLTTYNNTSSSSSKKCSEYCTSF